MAHEVEGCNESKCHITCPRHVGFARFQSKAPTSYKNAMPWLHAENVHTICTSTSRKRGGERLTGGTSFCWPSKCKCAICMYRFYYIYTYIIYMYMLLHIMFIIYMYYIITADPMWGQSGMLWWRRGTLQSVNRSIIVRWRGSGGGTTKSIIRIMRCY